MKALFLASVAVVPMVLMANPALAQTAQESPTTSDNDSAVEEGGAIIVTGQSRLSRDPVDAKRNSLAVVDSIGALEIQQLNDKTVADVLRRLPGITFQRAFQQNKAWYVSIRGLNGNYNSVDLDGGVFLDSTRNDRQNYLDTVPSAAINEIIVTKTVTPDMDGNSVGGHISIQTLRSFDLGGKAITKIDGSLDFHDMNGALKSRGPGLNANAVIKRTFGENGDFGFVLAGSIRDDRSSQEFNNTSGSFVRTTGVGIPSGLVQRGNFDIHDRGYSLLGKLEARSSDTLYAFLVGTRFKADISQLNYRGGINITPASVTNATESGGDFTGGSARANSRRYDINREVTTLTGGVEYALTESSKISATLAYGHSNHDETVWNSGFFAYNGLSGRYNFGRDAVDFALTPNAGLSNPANWAFSGTSGITRLPMTDDVYTGRLDYQNNNFELSRGFGFATGVFARRLDRSFLQSALNYTLPTGVNWNLSNFLPSSGRPSAFDGVGVTFVDFDKVWGDLKANGTEVTTFSRSSSFDLVEDVLAGYGSLYFTTDSLRVIAGARYEKTFVDNSTSSLLNGSPVPFAYKRDYDNFLPNVQAIYSPTDSLKLRAAYTRTMARPIFSSFAPGLTINNFTGTVPFTRGSNPDLTARVSDNLDFGIELYGSNAYFSVGVFQKWLKNEVYFQSFSERDAAGNVISTTIIPRNIGSSDLYGFEFSGDWHGTGDIVPALDGLGIRANLTILNGKLGVVNQDGSARSISGLQDQPKYTANVVLYYDNGPILGSIAYERRGETFSGTIGATKDLDFWIQPYSTLNAKIGVRPFDKLTVYAEGSNLTNSLYYENTGSQRSQLGAAIRSGVTFSLGAKLEF